MRGPGILMIAALLTTTLATGCGPNISSIRTGTIYSPREDACKVSFENLDYQHATAAYDSIGLITVAGGDLTEKVRDQVRAKACRMGADALSLNAAGDLGVGAA